MTLVLNYSVKNMTQ